LLLYIETNKLLWDHFSKLAFDSRQKGMSIPYADIVIAASALKEGAILARADSHFDSISNPSE